ncbi:ribitol-5-phosphate transferase FKTN-like [Watersipora subatra]|uniref:ribitol-5-phosphate transferase FKTN-like n=1 Tax=Watersipora subatra TaxID=2589382 RepID=UPI00355C65CD
MITKKQVTLGLGLVTACFTAIQLYLALLMPHLQPIHNLRLTTLQKFLVKCEAFKIRCVLLDHQTLSNLNYTPAKGYDRCAHLCQNRFYTFAVHDTDYKALKMEVLPIMSRLGYKILISSSEFIQTGIPTHIHLLHKDTPLIHLAVLHQMKTWWWYDSTKQTPFVSDFMKSEGVLDEFNCGRVTIDEIDVLIPDSLQHFLKVYDKSKFLRCNTTRAEVFHEWYGKDTTEKAEQFRSDAINALKIIKTRLDSIGTPFWLSSGTLLGWFRQCDIIPYSLDVDIGIFIKDHPENLLNILHNSSLRLEHKFGLMEDSLQYAFHIGNVKLDIFFFYLDETSGTMWNGGTDYNTGEKFKYLFDKFTLCWTEFFGMKVRVPCDTEQYIRANYGDSWIEPVTKWEWNKSPPNVEPNGEWQDDQLNDAIQLWDKEGKRIPLEWYRDES